MDEEKTTAHDGNKGSPWSTKDVDVGKMHAKSGCQKQRKVNLDLC